MSYMILKPIFSAVENTEFLLGNTEECFLALHQKTLHAFSHTR